MTTEPWWEKFQRETSMNFGKPLEAWTIGHDSAASLVDPSLSSEEIGGFKLLWKSRVYGGRKTGFEFAAVRWMASFDEGETYKRAVHGIALFDGLRHVYFGEDGDEAGYLNYPCAQSMALLWTKLRELEKLYCSQCDADLERWGK